MASIAIAWLALSLTCGSYAIECHNRWTTFHGSCYLHGRQAMSYADAEQFCRSHAGSHLVHINNRVEQTFLMNFLVTLQAPNHWIGLNDRHQEGTYVWTDHHTSAFVSWGAGQPSSGNGADCTAITRHSHYHWADSDCTQLFNPLCEMTNGTHGGETTHTHVVMTTAETFHTTEETFHTTEEVFHTTEEMEFVDSDN